MGGILKSTWEMLHDGRFLKKALMIACPVALQGMLNTIVNMVGYPYDRRTGINSDRSRWTCK